LALLEERDALVAVLIDRTQVVLVVSSALSLWRDVVDVGGHGQALHTAKAVGALAEVEVPFQDAQAQLVPGGAISALVAAAAVGVAEGATAERAQPAVQGGQAGFE